MYRCKQAQLLGAACGHFFKGTNSLAYQTRLGTMLFQAPKWTRAAIIRANMSWMHCFFIAIVQLHALWLASFFACNLIGATFW